MKEAKQIQTTDGVSNRVKWQCGEIQIGYSQSVFKKLTSISASSTHKDVVRMHFGMKGNYSFYYKQLATTFDLIGGHHNIMYSKDFDMVVHNRTLRLETFGIQFPKNMFLQFTEDANDILQRFSEKILSGKSALLTHNWGAIDASIQNVIRHILHNTYTGKLEELFLFSKSIELLVLCADACNRAETGKDIFIKNKTDKEKLIAARDIVNERLHCPPNLSEIAKETGLNEYKLKRGFKETFGTTVFGYLTEQRLHLALRYLLDTQKTAAEIAFELGYATPQHFNNAFRKKFGVTPKQVGKLK